jgi:Flp pilus assembly protein TadG
MTTQPTLKSLMARFAKSQTGTLAVTTALSVVPLCIVVGGAVDFSRFLNAKTELQSALDSATLSAATAKDSSTSQRIAIGKAVFTANVQDSILGTTLPEPKFLIKDGVVFGSVEAKMPTSFMQLAGLTELNPDAKTEVTIGPDKKAEVALVLDYSGSMEDVSGGQVKYIAMKNAAIALVKDLEATNPKDVKFALVPFSHHVYTTLPSTFVLGATGASWTGCTQDRKAPYNVSMATPGGSSASRWGQEFAPDHLAWGCDGYIDNDLKIRALTDNFPAITGQLATMKPYAWTNISVGVEFGFHVLSPNAPFAEGASFADKNISKYMVVLTDGEQTEPSFGPGGIRSVEQGEKNLVTLCSNAKAQGITMITVAFDLHDAATKTRLRNCATDPAKHAYVAEDSADISEAFQSIKDAIAAAAFVSK